MTSAMPTTDATAAKEEGGGESAKTESVMSCRKEDQGLQETGQ
jgi:hypothetical protein